MMKRGRSTLDLTRTPVQRYRDRVERLRDHVRAQGLEAALVYGDVSSGGDIAFLTHTTLYWGHAILVVPADGPTTLVMSLSPRTRDWFDATGVLDDQRSGPRIGELVHGLIVEQRLSRVGVVDQEAFPAQLLADAQRGCDVELVDLGPVVRDLRSVPDKAELADLADSAEIGRKGLEAAAGAAAAGEPEVVRAEAEYAMRAAGAWDATAVVHPRDAGGLSLQLRAQLRDAWYGAERTFDAPEDALVGALRDLYDELVRQLRPGVAERELLQYAEQRVATEVPIVEVRVESAPDVEWRPASVDPAAAVLEGAAIHLVLQAWDAEGRLLAAFGDTFLVGATGAEPILPGVRDLR